MTPDQVNIVNMILMVGSCVAAILVPFELFLAAYAILGPLHYLTQIAWLHTRGYFTTGRRDYLILGGLCVALVVIDFVPLGLRNPTYWGTTAMCLAFVGAAALAFVANPYLKIGLLAAALVVAQLISDAHAAQVVLMIFLPTIIHVYVFTAAFILRGALRSRSASGLASLAVFIICTGVLFLFAPSSALPAVGEGVRQRYQSFTTVNLFLSAWLPGQTLRSVEEVYSSSTGILLMRLIAFAYMYHYLNWFSKTSIIQWHKIPKAWAATNLVLWIAAVGLYAWDYKTGLLTLFFLSTLHVFLEFPLDYQAFVGIGADFAALVRPRNPAVATVSTSSMSRAARRSAQRRSAAAQRR